MGVDQDRGVVGVSHKELSNWYASVSAEFDGITPVMTDINVPYKGKTVVALLFETDRAPFVIKNPAYGVDHGVSIAFEVPWRDRTRTRTANRSDLIQLLVPILGLPEIEVMDGELKLDKYAAVDGYHWSLEMQLYITPQELSTIAIPFHRCSVSVKLSTLETPLNFVNMKLAPPYKPASGRIGYNWEPDSDTVTHTGSELILRGPGRANLTGGLSVNKQPENLENSIAEIQAKLSFAHTDKSVLLVEPMRWELTSETNEVGRWTR